VVSIWMDSPLTGNGFLDVKSLIGTKSVLINTGASGVILTITGGDMNIVPPNVYRWNGAPGISPTRNMVASITTAANAVFGTPGAGQFNSQAVTSVTLTASTFGGGILIN
jgi:hypothetical protein